MDGLRILTTVKSDFQIFINNNQLKDLQERNGTFAWTNQRKGFTNIAK